MNNNLLNIVKNQMGSAHLESKSTSEIIISFLGKFLQVIASTNLPIGSKARCSLERLRGVKIGKNVFMAGRNIIDRAYPKLVIIEDNVAISGGVNILAHSVPPLSLKKKIDEEISKISPVIIKNGAWIGINSIILPGVIVGENSIISAGSIVSKNVPPFTLVAGNPARMIKKLEFINTTITSEEDEKV